MVDRYPFAAICSRSTPTPSYQKRKHKVWERVQEHPATLRQMPLREAEQPGTVAADLSWPI